VLQVRPTGAPLDELCPGGIGSPAFKALSWLQRVVLGLAPRLFAFQWIFIARPVATAALAEPGTLPQELPRAPGRNRRRGRGR